MVTIPLIDLRAQYRSIQSEIDKAIQRVLDSGQFILGPEGEALEHEIATYCGTKYAVAVASGTDALELSLRVCGIGCGDEVVTSAFGFFATVEAVLAVGARPVFVDIDPSTYTLNPDKLASRIGPRTRAIIPVHLFGHPCAMDQVMAVARSHRLKVIEDCAQAIGAEYRGIRVGGFGDAAALSFYPTKNLGGYGDGGMVLTNNAQLAHHVRLLRNHGSRQRYCHLRVGTNSRLDELQAAVLRVKLKRLDRWNEARRRHAATYAALFRRRRVGDRIVLPQERPSGTHVYHLYTIRAQARSRLVQVLTRAGISTQVAYPSTLPAQVALTAHRKRPVRYPVAEETSRSVLSLPMYPELTRATISRIVDRVAQALDRS